MSIFLIPSQPPPYTITLDNLYNLINAFCSTAFLSHGDPLYCQNATQICGNIILQHKLSHFTHLASSSLRARVRNDLSVEVTSLSLLCLLMLTSRSENRQVLTHFLSFAHLVVLVKITHPVLLPFRCYLCLIAGIMCFKWNEGKFYTL